MNYLLGNPIRVGNAGLIYPVKMKDYMEFCQYAWTLEKSKKSLKREEDEMPLLYMLIEEDLVQEDENRRGLFIGCLIELIKIVTKSDVRFIVETYSFIIGGTKEKEDDGEIIREEIESEYFINADNFEEFREVVCKQNVIHEKRYHRPEFQKRIDEELAYMRRKNKGSSFETIFQIVSIKMGITYDVISNMTFMQVISNYHRIISEKSYDTSIKFKIAGADCEIEDFTKDLDIFKHPEDSLIQRKKGSEIKNLI